MMQKLYCRLFVVVIFCCAALSSAHAIDIKEVTSPGGIKAWLVEAHGIPLIAMDFAFAGGAALDPVGKEGTAKFITGMMDEGADDLDGPAFQAKRDKLSIQISFSHDKEGFYGSLNTLSKNRTDAFALLKKALLKPRFSEEPMDRMRKFFTQEAQQDLKDPGNIASIAWLRQAFPNHSYGRSASGTAESFATITVDDLRQLHKTLFSRSGMKIAVVGDIDAANLGVLLDDVFGGLPNTPIPDPTTDVDVTAGPVTKIVPFDTPQTIILFGGKGIRDGDPGTYAAYLMAEIIGGRASFSRFNTEVREKRGLTYGIGLSTNNLKRTGYVAGYLTTSNETAAEALKVVKDVLRDMRDHGPSAQELALAKTYLTGGYALRFDSNSSIASALLAMQLQNYPVTHIETRNDRVMAVTLEQVKEQSRNLLDPDKMIFTLVGKPVGME